MFAGFAGADGVVDDDGDVIRTVITIAVIVLVRNPRRPSPPG